MRHGFILTLFLIGLSSQALAIEPRLIDYRVELHAGWPLSGKISERLRQLADGTWQLERNGLVFGFTAIEVSKFQVNASEVQSIWYRKEQSGLPGGSRTEFSFPPNTTNMFDPISLAIKIGADLRANPSLTTSTYVLSEKKGKQKSITFKFVPNVKLKTDIGLLETVRVDQLTDSDSERSYWLSPTLDYIIIRAIERDEDGDIKSEINIRNGSIGNRSIKAN